MGYSDPDPDVGVILVGAFEACFTHDDCGFGSVPCWLWHPLKHSDEAFYKLVSPAVRLHGPSGIQWHTSHQLYQPKGRDMG